jgi:hypothetical protein
MPSAVSPSAMANSPRPPCRCRSVPERSSHEVRAEIACASYVIPRIRTARRWHSHLPRRRVSSIRSSEDVSIWVSRRDDLSVSSA